MMTMRTTVEVDAQILRAAKARASEQQSSLSHVVEEALRAYLLLVPEAKDEPLELPVFGTRGGRCPSPAEVASLLTVDDEQRSPDPSVFQARVTGIRRPVP